MAGQDDWRWLQEGCVWVGGAGHRARLQGPVRLLSDGLRRRRFWFVSVAWTGVARGRIMEHDLGRDPMGLCGGQEGLTRPRSRWVFRFRWGVSSGYKDRGRCVRGQAGVGPPSIEFGLAGGNLRELVAMRGFGEGAGAKIMSLRKSGRKAMRLTSVCGP